MSKFELIFDMIVAFILFGLIGVVGTFFGLLFWAQIEVETMFFAVIMGGVTAGVLGALVPFLRKTAVFILSLFVPSSW